MTELLILKVAFIIVMGAAATKLHSCASDSTRYSCDWYTCHLLSVLTGILALNEFGHLVSLVRGGSL